MIRFGLSLPAIDHMTNHISLMHSGVSEVSKEFKDQVKQGYFINSSCTKEKEEVS